MPISILMPSLSPTMADGSIAKWLKKEGDLVKSGDVLAEIETDKAVMELEALNDGKLFRIIVQAGEENIKINSLIAILQEEEDSNEDVEQFILSMQQDKASSASSNAINDKISEGEQVSQHVKETLSDDIDNKEGRRILISPLAKKIANLEKIEISSIKGSGPYGRIIKRDVIGLKAEKSINSSESSMANSYRIEKASKIQRIIAQRLSESKANIPHFYLTIECNIDNLINYRSRLNQKLSERNIRVSINDFIILTCAKIIRQIPEINSSWDQDSIIYYNNVDISVAVSTERGLVTPIIKDPDKKNIVEISTQMKNLINRARENKLKPEEFQGGNFSISNLGMYGIKQFYAIINPPQSCILSVSKASKQAIVVHDTIKIATILNLGISCDHRVIDGVIGAKFLSLCKEYLESPELLLT